MLFEFNLSPVEQVRTWGEAPDQTIHWFALTQGEYRIKVGAEYLLNFSQEYLAYCRQIFPADTFESTFTEYYVVRLWEDVLDILQHVIEPVPPQLRRLISSSYKTRADWIEHIIESEDELSDLSEFAAFWLSERILDSGYLKHSPEIWLWSDENEVIINWDNRGIEVACIPVWSASHGEYRIKRAEFIYEVRDFNRRLFAAMSKRIEDICRLHKNSAVSVNLADLQNEQRKRATWLESHLTVSHPTDWNKVIAAINSVSASHPV